MRFVLRPIPSLIQSSPSGASRKGVGQNHCMRMASSTSRKIRNSQPRDNRAFTILEVIAALIIIGIMAGIAVTAFFSTDTYTAKSQIELVKAHLRYAQSRAIHSHSAWGWGINFAGTRNHAGRTYSTYWLYTNGDDSTPVRFQVEDDYRHVVVFSDGAVGIWPLVIGAVTKVEFDKWGSPGSSTITIPTSEGGIVITRNTGYID